MGKKIIIYALVVALFVPAVVFGAEKISGVSGFSTADACEDAASENEQVYYDDELEIKLDEALSKLETAANEEEFDIGYKDVLSFVGTIYSHKKTEERYQKLLEIGEKVNTILDKVNNIENALYGIINQYKIDAYVARIDQRHVLTNTLNNHSKPVLASIYNSVKDSKGNIPTDWLSKNYESIFDNYLYSWANATVEGTVCYTQVINLLTNVADGQIGTDRKTLPEIYDTYAYKIYPWEHLGYKFRESQRLVDLIAAVENAALLDIYYDCMNRIKGENVYSFHQDQLVSSIQTYTNTCNSVPVTRNDDKRICQMPGLEGKTFAIDVDYLDLYTSIRSACQNDSFKAIYEDSYANNKKLLDDAFDHVKVYKNPGLTVLSTTYGGTTTYQPRETYEKLWAYYKGRIEAKKGTIKGQAYNNLTEALSLHDFKGFEKIGNLYFATEKNENYHAWRIYFKNNFAYRSWHLQVRTWKKRKDTIWLWVVDNKGNYIEETLIYNCNFKGSEKMDSPGVNAHNNFMSLREIK